MPGRSAGKLQAGTFCRRPAREWCHGYPLMLPHDHPLLAPIIAFGQGYEWSDRSFQVPGNGGAYWQNYRQIEGTEYGVYAVSPGALAKYRAEDGKLLWRRELDDLGSTTTAYSITVNARGVLVAGGFPVTGGTYQQLRPSLFPRRRYRLDHARLLL